MKRATLNIIVKKMSEKQNKNSKLNAGQLREAVTLFLKSIVDLSNEEKLSIVADLSK
jgi:hypothetical protein